MKWVKRWFNNKTPKASDTEDTVVKEAKLAVFETERPSAIPTDFTLNPSDPTWNYILNWADVEVTRLHRQLERQDKDHSQTMALRGELKSLRKLLDLPRKGILTNTRRRSAV